MSFLKKLFGGGGGADTGGGGGEAVAAELEHEGFHIKAMPQKEGGQYRVCGEISRTVDGAVRTHRLIRADLFASREEAANATLRKARQVIAERGDRLFE
ncbi:MAG: hypothetical protein GC150_09635 [Rhizobiales bacterium]|nr:hypothetical protein [Hyphomicrobiales bacterium]